MQIELKQKFVGGELLKSLPSGWEKGDNEDFAVATAEVKDRDGDVIRVNGISLEYHRKDAPIKVFGKAHNYKGLADGTPSVMGVVKEFISTQLQIRGEHVPCLAFKYAYAGDDKGELTPYAAKMKGLYRGGTLDAFSIGVEARRVKSLKGGRYDVEASALFEISSTPMPTNPYATILKSLKEGLGEDFDADEYMEAQMIELRKSIDSTVLFQEKLLKRFDDIESAIVAASEVPAGQTSNRQSPQIEELNQLQKSIDALRAQLV